MKSPNDQAPNRSRRQFIVGTTVAAAASLLPNSLHAANHAAARSGAAGKTPALSRRRKLGSLEVSAIGMGVQNMHRKYTTEVPYRPEMINILRTAFDRGVTFFDCAEAYGPFEN